MNPGARVPRADALTAQALARHLRHVRKLRSWTQERFAGELGVSRATLNGWERARTDPSPTGWAKIWETLDRIGEPFGIKPHSFLNIPLLVPPDMERHTVFGVSRDWIQQRFGINDPKLIAIQMPDGSMESAIKAGEVCMADESDQSRMANRDGIYLVSLGGLPLVRRIQVLPSGSLWVSGDNPLCQPYELQPAAGLQILGRVLTVLKKL